jgi:uncharacterized protein (DUF1800 family)
MSYAESTVASVRFGFGFHPLHEAPRGADDLLRQVRAGYMDTPDIGGPTIGERFGLSVKPDPETGRLEYRSTKQEMEVETALREEQLSRDKALRLRTAALSPYGFYERLVWFWSDHFTVRAMGRQGLVAAGRFEPDVVRPLLTGSFRDMLIAAETHPAMVFYLDQVNSFGPTSRAGRKQGKGLNENLAREILELHTLGVGADYTQDDVRQFAELLTGVTFDMKTGEAQYRRRMAEPGTERVMGRRYGYGPARMAHVRHALEDLAAHPATARYLARKLAVHFVSDRPSEALVAHLEAAYIRSGGELMPVYEALLEHPESWSSFGAKVKQPMHFVVSSMRATGLSPELVDAFLASDGPLSAERAMRRLNQPLLDPPGPNGWPEAAEDWINAPGLTARIDWASRIGNRITPETDPAAFMELALADHVSRETAFAVTHAAEKWEGVALVLASPEFNRH